MEDDERLMNLALELARDCGDDVPVGALIVKDGQIIARGTNQRERKQNPIGHAELVAISEAAALLKTWRLDGCTIYCTLEPCPMCAEAILQARIGEVVFGAFDEQYGAMGSKFNLYVKGRPFPLPKVRGGILLEECRDLIKSFFQRRRAEGGGAPK